MLKYGEINPLAVFGLRQLEHCPPHFTAVDFERRTANDKVISDWVWTNLAGRFWYGDYYYKSADGNVQVCKRIAFEIPSEASMFALIIDSINVRSNDTIW
jgi:hypothetical protein